MKHAGIARVVSALEDPDSRVSGLGHQMLRDAGIDLVTGVCEAEAYDLNLGFILNRIAHRPMVTLKLPKHPTDLRGHRQAHDDHGEESATARPSDACSA